MKKFLFILILISFSPFVVYASEETRLISWDFEGPDQLKGWSGVGVEASRLREGVFQISGKEEFRLLLPAEFKIKAEENPYLRIRFKINSPRVLRVFWQSRNSRPWVSPSVIQPPYSSHFHTYWVNLAKSPQWYGEISHLGLIFAGRPGWVEMDSVEFRPFSLGDYLKDQWKEFSVPGTLTLASINSLNSPRVFGRPSIWWSCIAALVIMIAGAFLWFKARPDRKVSIVSRMGTVLLLLWLTNDLRETYSQFMMTKEIYHSYVKASPEKRTFPALGDFYGFVKFARDNIPNCSPYYFYSDRYWPYDCRLKYFLYPRRIRCETLSSAISKKEIPWYLVYNSTQISYDPIPRRLRLSSPQGSYFLSRPGTVVARYNNHSFVFVEDQ